jgi:hypothetical protein
MGSFALISEPTSHSGYFLRRTLLIVVNKINASKHLGSPFIPKTRIPLTLHPSYTG